VDDVAATIHCDAEGVLVERPNRFLAIVDIDGADGTVPGEKAHVHDPGRLLELLYPGNRLLLRRAGNPLRKTAWDVIAARHGEEWILIHSGFHREIAAWLLSSPDPPFGKLADIRPEVTVGHSRLDFMAMDKMGRTIGIEVKGCTLAIDGTALFPDAPTERGRKHVNTLIGMVESGDRAGLLVLVLGPDAERFAPKADTDPAFAEAFWKAVDNGVEVHAVRFGFDGENVHLMGEIPVTDRSY